MTVTVSVRLDEKVVRFLEKTGRSAGTEVKRIVMEEFRREIGLAALDSIRKKSIKVDFNVAELIRKERDRL